MQVLIEIPEETVNEIKDNAMFAGSISSDIRWDVTSAIVNGKPLDEKELRLKRWIEKDIKMLNEIIESGWLISDLEKCPAIDACEDAITALEQYPVLDKVRAEIEQAIWEDVVVSLDGTDETRIPRLDPDEVLEIIDKYRGNVDEI